MLGSPHSIESVLRGADGIRGAPGLAAAGGARL